MTGIILDKGVMFDTSIEFVKYVGPNMRVDARVWVTREEWDAMGCPNQVKLQVNPVFG